jgi:hypothetical protein
MTFLMTHMTNNTYFQVSLHLAQFFAFNDFFTFSVQNGPLIAYYNVYSKLVYRSVERLSCLVIMFTSTVYVESLHCIHTVGRDDKSCCARFSLVERKDKFVRST